MILTESQLARVLAAVREKVPEPRACQVCGQDEWQIQDGIAQVLLSAPPLPTASLGRPSLTASVVLPSVVLVCTTCGQTVFLNAIVLGLGDLLSPPPPSGPLFRPPPTDPNQALVLRPHPEAVAEVGGLRMRELRATSDRLGRLCKHRFQWDAVFGALAILIAGAVIGGALGLIQFLNTAPSPSYGEKTFYIGALAAGAVITVVFLVARMAVRSERAESVLAIKEDFDAILDAYAATTPEGRSESGE